MKLLNRGLALTVVGAGRAALPTIGVQAAPAAQADTNGVAAMADRDKNYFDPKVLAGISNLYLRARWVVEGMMSGLHRSRAKGFSVEFEEHRDAIEPYIKAALDKQSDEMLKKRMALAESEREDPLNDNDGNQGDCELPYDLDSAEAE